MATKPKAHKLDLSTVLNSLDRKDITYYNRLSEDDKKGYVPLVLMRYMSSLTDQNNYASIAVLLANDFVNIGFWEISKHPELQHLLLCMTGLGPKQYRPWISTKKEKNSNKITSFLMDLYPDLNYDEIQLIKDQYDIESWTAFVTHAGLSDSEIKELITEWKKISK